ncbi:hypothetical protein A6V39_00665 [Candidatus Mycoplasma haematobovis]|uniref:Uncharacterized protein n=1 Tax=Candidatus Mycoplasma haematobovis TaxID=432608 RepID=A0A1A9QDM1_9MOLU|nr:hypothetical protein [Candidatus Mycoplasma haematobovis]OAL10563.1 hypothetical protein A6V39_00665 [Candidatus Mycoplasma haematobovis]
MGLTLKVGSTIGVAGLAGGGAVLAYSFSGNSKSVRNELEKIGYYVLKDSDLTEKWQKVFDAYRAKPEGSKKFDTNVADLPTLKKKCKALLDTDFKKETDYSVIKKWCVKEETIEAMLTRNEYEKIGASSASGNNEKWQAKVTALKNDTTSTNKIITTFNSGSTSEVSQLETACGNLKMADTKTHSDDEFEKKFIQARDWCSIKKNAN